VHYQRGVVVEVRFNASEARAVAAEERHNASIAEVAFYKDRATE
jgi:hypothetical protein